MFCKFCGNQVPDGYVCNCPEAQAARAAEAAPVATAAPAAGNTGAAIGSAFSSLPGSFKTLLGNAEGPGTNVITAAIYAVGSLILNILGWVLIVAGLLGTVQGEAGDMWDYMKEYFEGIYGYAVLGGLWTCIVPIALSMVVIIVGQLIRKENIDIVSAFTTAACINVAPSVIFLVGALFSTFLAPVGIFLILVGIIVYLASVYKLVGKLVPNTTGIVGGLIVAAVVAVVLALMAMIVWGVIEGCAEENTEAVASLITIMLQSALKDMLGSLY